MNTVVVVNVVAWALMLPSAIYTTDYAFILPMVAALTLSGVAYRQQRAVENLARTIRSQRRVIRGMRAASR